MKSYIKGNLYSNTAKYYDFDNRDIIKDDLDFYVNYAQKTEGDILELACGTGRVSLYIAEKTGRTIDCLELSTSMLDQLEKKLETSSKHLKGIINIHNKDMTTFDLHKTFEYILIPWRALQWLPTKDQAISCLKHVKKHLKKEGIFIFDIFKPRVYDDSWVGTEVVSYDIVDKCGARIIRSTINHSFDNKDKFIKYLNRYRIIEDKNEIIHEDLLTVKYYAYEDICKILEHTGFTIKEQYGYYDKRSIENGDEMIFVCKG